MRVVQGSLDQLINIQERKMFDFLSVTLFLANASILYTLKTPENQR